jgi:NAD(P)-dependent dehydrogenase (short-subunit alcohol dehydrogenase family)
MNVFITGASSGIGAQFARLYASQGATLGLVARRGDALGVLVESLPKPAQGTHQVYALDVTQKNALQEAARSFLATVGVPQIVIANAGISRGTLTEFVEDIPVFEQIIATNLTATVTTFQPFIEPMRAMPGARLVGISSVAGVRGLPGASAYSASKAAVRSYCESLRIELAKTEIRVVTIAPGYIATPMTSQNPYPMPFLMPVERFVEQAGAAIAKGVSYRVIPWPMRWVARLMHILPNRLFDRLAANAGRKPRKTAT